MAAKGAEFYLGLEDSGDTDSGGTRAASQEEKESGRRRATRLCALPGESGDGPCPQGARGGWGGAASHEYLKFLADVLDASVRTVSGQRADSSQAEACPSQLPQWPPGTI